MSFVLFLLLFVRFDLFHFIFWQGKKNILPLLPLSYNIFSFSFSFSFSFFFFFFPPSLPPKMKLFLFFSLGLLFSCCEGITIREEFQQLIEDKFVPTTCSPLPTKRKIFGSGYHVIISSPGGTGSSHILTQTERRFNVNQHSNHDGFKHTHLPPLFNPKKMARQPYGSNKVPKAQNNRLKAMYVFGDPVETLVSLYRRDFLKKQIITTSAGTCRFSAIEPLNKLRKVGTNLLDMSGVEIKPNPDKKAFDPLRMNEHYLHWLFDETPYDRIFISGPHSQDVMNNFSFLFLFSYPFSDPNGGERFNKEMQEYEGYFNGNEANSELLLRNLKEANTVFNYSRPHARSSANLTQSFIDAVAKPYKALKAFISQLPLVFVRLGNRRNEYKLANSTTFDESLSGKFLGDFDMDKLLNTDLSTFYDEEKIENRAIKKN